MAVRRHIMAITQVIVVCKSRADVMYAAQNATCTLVYAAIAEDNKLKASHTADIVVYACCLLALNIGLSTTRSHGPNWTHSPAPHLAFML